MAVGVVGRAAVGRVAVAGRRLAGWRWAGGGGSEGMYAMRTDRPLVAEDVSTPPADGNSSQISASRPGTAICSRLPFCRISSRPRSAGKTWDQRDHGSNHHLPSRYPVVATGSRDGDDSIDDLRILAVTERPEAMGEILNQASEPAAVLHAAPDDDRDFASPHIFRDEAGRSRRRGGDDASEASLQQTTAHAILSDPVSAVARARPLVLSGRPRADRAADRECPDRSDGAIRRPAESPYEASLLKLAEEIGLNRVIAGFHFRSDIEAGAEAGRLTHEFLRGMPGRQSGAQPPNFDFASAIAAAKAEWQ